MNSEQFGLSIFVDPEPLTFDWTYSLQKWYEWQKSTYVWNVHVSNETKYVHVQRTFGAKAFLYFSFFRILSSEKRRGVRWRNARLDFYVTNYEKFMLAFSDWYSYDINLENFEIVFLKKN